MGEGFDNTTHKATNGNIGGSRATENGHNPPISQTGQKPTGDFLFGERFFLKVFLHKFIFAFSGKFNQLKSKLFNLVGHIGRSFRTFAAAGMGFLGNQIHYPFKFLTLANG